MRARVTENGSVVIEDGTGPAQAAEPEKAAEPAVEEASKAAPAESLVELEAQEPVGLDDYIERAIRTCGLSSDRGLAALMKLSPSTVNNWRKHKAWPSEEVMLDLADKAGRDADIALLHLCLWRAHSERVRTVLTDILTLVYHDKIRRAQASS